MYLQSRRPPLARLGPSALIAVLALAGCDRSTADLVQEIDDAREGCTEEMLAAGSEECVQMFEKYVDMGSEAIGTYIGAMRALDEALKRRPGLQFDTTGLGHAITPGAADGDTTATSRWLLEPRTDEGTRYRNGETREPAIPSWEADPEPYGRSGGGTAQPDSRPYPEEAGGPRSGEPSRPAWDPAPSRRPAADDEAPSGPRERAAPPSRGGLLPPDERLRRPWIGDDEPRTQYYPDGAPPRADDRPREAAPEPGTGRRPYDDPPRPF